MSDTQAEPTAEDVKTQELVTRVVGHIIDSVMDNYGLIDDRSLEYVELTEEQLRRILLDTVGAVADAVHDEFDLEH